MLTFVLSVFLSALVTTTAIAAPPGNVNVLVGFKKIPGPPEEALIHGHGGKIKYTYHIVPVIAASLPEPAIAALEANPRVAYVEDDGIVQATEDTLPWGVDRIDADLVWPTGNTGAGVRIAIIDTGIDYTHPDLASNFEGGYDFVNDDPDPMDDNWHGTHVAGIAAARADGAGVVGVAPDAELYGVKVLDSGGSGFVSDVVAGIQWAINNGMDIMNMSLGTNWHFQTLQDAVDTAYFTNDIVVVASAGNDALPPFDTIDYPARYSSVIAVGATDSADVRASWSSTGLDLELMSPGVGILSTFLGGAFVSASGTSMASPHTAGTAALVIASGVAGAANVRQVLIDTADDLGDPGRDQFYGWGLTDADEAATGGTPPPPNDPPVVTIISPLNGDVFESEDLITFQGTASDTEDGDLTASLIWESNIDGTIGTGGFFQRTLPPGEHTITASVTDSGGKKGSDTVSTTVNSPPPPPPPPPGTANLQGTVEDAATGDPIGGATVKAQNATDTYSTKTGADGSYLLSDLPCGTYEVTASAKKYGSETEPAVEICPDKVQNFSLSKKGGRGGKGKKGH